VDIDLWRTTALDLVDGQTKALTFAQQARADSGDDRWPWRRPPDRL